MTQLDKARKKIYTKEMRFISRYEDIDIKILIDNVRKGTVVIPANRNHKSLKRPIGIGKDLKVKVNANIGGSPLDLSLKKELKKMEVAIEAGADTIMDLTIANNPKDIDRIRRKILEKSSVPVGTVPIYQAVIEAGGPQNLTIKKYLEVYERQAKEGVDFTTVHAGIKRRALSLVKKRLIPCVSRGGSIILSWMKKNREENFLYKYFDDILDIAKEFDVTISLGDGLRPGCIFDATDRAQIYELKVLGELVIRAQERGVQVMVEGPGHIPLNEIEKNIKLEKRICKDAPFYVLGPLPIDRAVGYDHIASAIGGAWAGYLGADFLCYVTPREHIGLPDINDVREGVIVTKIASSIADLARGNKNERLKNNLISSARKAFNWNKMLDLSIDPEKFEDLLTQSIRLNKGCSMCGDKFCALRIFR